MSEAAKHTPGPWQVSRGGVIVTTDSSGMFDALNAGKSFTVRRICDCENRYYIGEQGAQANARLIAAAPELLEVARAIVEDREACGIDERDPDDPMAAIVRKARAAIAKATGRPST